MTGEKLVDAGLLIEHEQVLRLFREIRDDTFVSFPVLVGCLFGLINRGKGPFAYKDLQSHAPLINPNTELRNIRRIVQQFRDRGLVRITGTVPTPRQPTHILETDPRIFDLGAQHNSLRTQLLDINGVPVTTSRLLGAFAASVGIEQVTTAQAMGEARGLHPYGVIHRGLEVVAAGEDLAGIIEQQERNLTLMVRPAA